MLVALWTNNDSVNVGWVAGERMLVTNIVLKKPGKVESISPTWGKSLRFLGHLVPVIIDSDSDRVLLLPLTRMTWLDP